MTQSAALEGFFGTDGDLARVLPGYAPRPGQLAMARAVAEALAYDGHLLVEAGTGTGKTLAYLVPALLSGRKVVVSTATKTLQTQILDKEIPLIRAATGRPVAAAILKGRQNYLCLRRFEGFRAQPLFRFVAEAEVYARLERWAGSTGSGDRAELADLPDDYGPWREICSTTDTCWGGRCPREAECHLNRQRRAAQKAQLLVVNHHLFCADLALRSASPAAVLPNYDSVVFDEAHHLEAVATQHFGTRISSYQIGDLLRDLAGSAAATAGNRGRGGGKEDARDLLPQLESAAAALWAALPRSERPLRLRDAPSGAAATALEGLLQVLARLTVRLAPRQGESLELEALHRRTLEAGAALERFRAAPPPGEVRWLERRGRGAFLHAAPVEVAGTLGSALGDAGCPVVWTSATLQLGGSFTYLRTRLGISPDAQELVVESPFCYASQGLLYVPRDMPDANAPEFATRTTAQLEVLLRSSRGRAFCLFTSHRMLRAAAEGLRGRLPYPLLVQGEAPREVLLRRFREELDSVLLGAQSFWEGVDVPGEALSAVIIDKIPFANPADPLVEARIEELRSRGESPFGAYQLPAAAMALRQGTGRLIRSAADRGLVAVLDRRLVERSYGRFLRSALPDFRFTRDVAEVTAFFGT